jgi:hypothetical protein
MLTGPCTAYFSDSPSGLSLLNRLTQAGLASPDLFPSSNSILIVVSGSGIFLLNRDTNNHAVIPAVPELPDVLDASA